MFLDNYLLLFEAVVVGFIFGFLLQKGRVAQFNTIVGQLLFKDFTMMKVMLTAILVSSFGLYTMLDFNIIPAITLRAMPLSRILMGGTLFGIGIGILGYCPGTALVAWADGAKDSLFGILGMFFGSFVFLKISSFIPSDVVTYRYSISSYFGFSHWWIIVGLFIVLIGIVFADRLFKK